MTSRTILITGACFAAAAVALGAFGAHGLKELLIANGRVDTFNLAVEYHFYHAFALLITGMLMHIVEAKGLRLCGYLFLGGILFFSGSLYILSITNVGILGAITPIGGVLFIAGWLRLVWSLYNMKKASDVRPS